MDLLNRVSSLYLSYRHDPCQWSIPPILQGPDYLLHVLSAVRLSFRSQYSEFSMVILYSWLCLLKLVRPSIQKFLIIGLLGSCSALSRFSLPRIFWSILGGLLCMQHIRNSTADSLSRTTSCHAGFYIMLWISALRISMDFISLGSQSDWSTIDYLTKSAHFILFRMSESFEVLAVLFYK